jgi:hypothetical protein
VREVFTHDNFQQIIIDNSPQILQAIRPLAFYLRCRHYFDGMYVNNYVQMNSFQIELKTSQRVVRFQESEQLGKLVELVHCGRRMPVQKVALGVSAVGSPARAGIVCPRFHRMFALTYFPLTTSACFCSI